MYLRKYIKEVLIMINMSQDKLLCGQDLILEGFWFKESMASTPFNMEDDFNIKFFYM